MTFHTYNPPDQVCQECGIPEDKHYWRCEKCNVITNWEGHPHKENYEQKKT